MAGARVIAASGLQDLAAALPWIGPEGASRLARAFPARPLVVEAGAEAGAVVQALDEAGVLSARAGDRIAWVADPERTARLHARLRETAPETFQALGRALAGWGAPAADLPLPSGGALLLSRRCHLMGIVNVTPDSFSDGGSYLDAAAAIEHGLRLAEEGAGILDVGGESTRPGSEPVTLDEERRRVLPVIEALAVKSGMPVSVDTTKAAVAREALDAGAQIVNDVSAGRFDPDLLPLCAQRGAPVILMHMLGDPRTMQRDPRYRDVVGEIADFLTERARAARDAGLPADRILVDPGFGFGKTREHNLVMLKRLREFRCLGYPVVVGTSRKSFIGLTLDLPPEERLEGTAATVALAVAAGAAVVRVHDVREMARVASMVEAVVGAGGPGAGAAGPAGGSR